MADQASKPALTALVEQSFAGQVLSSHAKLGDETIVIKRDRMLDIFQFLKTDARCQFNLMVDVTAVDLLPATPRFEVVYHLKSIPLKHRIRIKVPIEEKAPEVDTISNLWVAADWYEREVFDMYGITFKGHPNLKRLLMYEGFEGYPLRKDYTKGLAQPLVEMRPVKERYNYGETYKPVTQPVKN
ncbi:MAG TPA: NADH-quinone oxidoreductase subunit C [bacterium]